MGMIFSTVTPNTLMITLKIGICTHVSKAQRISTATKAASIFAAVRGLLPPAIKMATPETKARLVSSPLTK